MWKSFNLGWRSESSRDCLVAWEDQTRKNTRGKRLNLCVNLRELAILLSPIQLAATLDLFPTVMNLAGGKMPSVITDGVDMSPVLFENKEVATVKFKDINSIVLQSNRQNFVYYSQESTPQTGLYALRLRQYKAHFYTRGFVSHLVLDTFHYLSRPSLVDCVEMTTLMRCVEATIPLWPTLLLCSSMLMWIHLSFIL